MELRNAGLNYLQFDSGHIMENMIYMEHSSRYSVGVGVIENRRNGKKTQREVDSVVNEGNKRVSIQSAIRMDAEGKTVSETASLILTKDFSRKIIIRNTWKTIERHRKSL